MSKWMTENSIEEFKNSNFFSLIDSIRWEREVERPLKAVEIEEEEELEGIELKEGVRSECSEWVISVVLIDQIK